MHGGSCAPPTNERTNIGTQPAQLPLRLLGTVGYLSEIVGGFQAAAEFLHAIMSRVNVFSKQQFQQSRVQTNQATSNPACETPLLFLTNPIYQYLLSFEKVKYLHIFL